MNQKKNRLNNRNISKYRWFIWGILVTIYLIVFFHRLSVGVITEELKKTFDMNATQIANLGAMYFYAYIVMQIPTGVLADYMGPKKTVTVGSLVAGIGSVVFALSQTIYMAYLGRLLVGLGVSVVFLCILKIQSSWFPAEKFATMSGLTSFIGSMGGLLAQTPLVALVALIGWRNSFLAMGIVTFLMSALVVTFVKNTPGEIGFEEVNPRANSSGENQHIMLQLLEEVRSPRIWPPAFVFGGVNGGFLVFTGTFGVSYITNVYKLSNTYAANMISIVLLISGISCLLVGGISDKIKSRKIPMIFLAATTAAAWSILVLLKPPLFVLFILISLIGVTSSMGVVCWSVGKEVSNPRLSGMAMSIVNVFGFIFTAILMVICGKIIDMNISSSMDAGAAYTNAFVALIASSFIALAFSFFATETKCMNIYKK